MLLRMVITIDISATTIGEKLKKLRSERDITIPEINRLTGVGVGTIGDLERGRIANPGVFTLLKICKALRVNISYFLEDDINYTPGVDVNKAKYLLKEEYVHLFEDDRFKDYLAVTQKAFGAGIKSDTLDKLVDVLISDCR